MEPSSLPRVHAAAVVASLVNSGLVEEENAGKARAEAERVLAANSLSDAGQGRTRKRLAEIAGYVGAALLLGGIYPVLPLLLRNDYWLILLAGISVSLLLAGVLLQLGEGRGLFRVPRLDWRRRLVSVLYTAGTLVGTVFVLEVLTKDEPRWSPDPGIIAGLFCSALMAIGLRLVPTVLGHLGLAGSLACTLLLLSNKFEDSLGFELYGPSLLALSAVWVIMCEQRLWAQERTSQLVSGALAIAGAASYRWDGVDGDWPRTILMLLVAAVFTALYFRRQTWSYHTVSVAAILVGIFMLAGVLGFARANTATFITLGLLLLGASAFILRRHSKGEAQSDQKPSGVGDGTRKQAVDSEPRQTSSSPAPPTEESGP